MFYSNSFCDEMMKWRKLAVGGVDLFPFPFYFVSQGRELTNFMLPLVNFV